MRTSDPSAPKKGRAWRRCLVAVLLVLMVVAGAGFALLRLGGGQLFGTPGHDDAGSVGQMNFSAPVPEDKLSQAEEGCRAEHAKKCGAGELQYYCLKDVTGAIVGCVCMPHDALMGSAWCDSHPP